jgi:hypothetical protein
MPSILYAVLLLRRWTLSISGLAAESHCHNPDFIKSWTVANIHAIFTTGTHSDGDYITSGGDDASKGE